MLLLRRATDNTTAPSPQNTGIRRRNATSQQWETRTADSGSPPRHRSSLAGWLPLAVCCPAAPRIRLTGLHTTGKTSASMIVPTSPPAGEPSYRWFCVACQVLRASPERAHRRPNLQTTAVQAHDSRTPGFCLCRFSLRVGTVDRAAKTPKMPPSMLVLRRCPRTATPRISHQDAESRSLGHG